MPGLVPARERGIEIQSGGGGERVDGGGVTAHRGGENARDDEPREARGELGDHERGVDRVAPHPAVVRAGEPEARAHEQEQRELQDDEHPRADERTLRVLEAAGREQSLDDQVVGPVRRGREETPAHHAAPERVQRRERRPEVEGDELALVPGPRERAGAARELGCHDERRDPAQEIHAQLDHVHPHHGPQPADPRVDQGHDADREDAGGETPMRDDRERDRGGEDAHAVGERPCEQEHARRGAARRGPEAALQSLVRRLLRALEVAREEQGGDADPAHEVPEGELEEREVPPGRDARNGDHRQGRRLGGHDRQHQGPPRQPAMPEEVVARVALAACEHQPEDDDGDAVRRDDGYVEGAHGRTAKSPRRARAWNADCKGANGLRP